MLALPSRHFSENPHLSALIRTQAHTSAQFGLFPALFCTHPTSRNPHRVVYTRAWTMRSVIKRLRKLACLAISSRRSAWHVGGSFNGGGSRHSPVCGTTADPIQLSKNNATDPPHRVERSDLRDRNLPHPPPCLSTIASSRRWIKQYLHNFLLCSCLRRARREATPDISQPQSGWDRAPKPHSSRKGRRKIILVRRAFFTTLCATSPPFPAHAQR
jgi:hypothetical protein